MNTLLSIGRYFAFAPIILGLGLYPGVLMGYLLVLGLGKIGAVGLQNDVKSLILLLATIVLYYYVLGRKFSVLVIFKFGMDKWPEYEKYFKKELQK